MTGRLCDPCYASRSSQGLTIYRLDDPANTISGGEREKRKRKKKKEKRVANK